jgi:hypothetical protein
MFGQPCESRSTFKSPGRTLGRSVIRRYYNLRFFADRASKKWPLRGSLKESGVLVAYLA